MANIEIDDGSQTPSLPSPVKTPSEKDGQCEDASDNISLPESVNSEVLGGGVKAPATCCSKNCAMNFRAEDLETYKLELQQGKPQQIQDRKFECLKEMFAKNSQDQKTLTWFYCGQRVCRKFWESTHGLSPGKVDSWLKLCRNGQVKLPPRAPKAPKPEPTMDRVGLWFLSCYQHLAEPLAVEGSEDQRPNAEVEGDQTTVLHEIVDDVSHPLFSLSFLAGAGANEPRLAGKRYVNFSSLLDFYAFYKADVATEEAVSRSTFDRCYNRSWNKHLILRSPSGGNKCSICLRLEEERSQASNEAERMQIDLQRQQHLDICKRDRAVNTRGNLKGADLKNFQPANRHQGFLKLMLDGMDQQKFSMPRARKLQGTADYGKAWKANCHVVGCILWGIAEIYFLMPMDIAKDSSMECTLVGRALDLAKKFLHSISEELDLPDNLVIAIDNTAREGKNQVFAQFCAWMASQIFANVEIQYMQVSHTHNELDQRFSSMARVVKRADSIQSLDDLHLYLEQNMTPAAGRMMHVEVVKNTFYFNGWLQSMTGCQISGLTSTRKEGANHLWRFCRREFLGQETVECEHDQWKEDGEHPQDIIAVFKQFMSDVERSQNPQLIMPVKVWQSLKKCDLLPGHRNPLGSTTIAEFRKTAKLVGSPPWQLLEAQEYLETLCLDNEADKVDAPPELIFIFSKEGEAPRVEAPDGPALDGLILPDSAPPRRIRVKSRPVNAKQKAKAKANLAGSKKKPAANNAMAAVNTPDRDLLADVVEPSERPEGEAQHGLKRPAAAPKFPKKRPAMKVDEKPSEVAAPSSSPNADGMNIEGNGEGGSHGIDSEVPEHSEAVVAVPALVPPASEAAAPVHEEPPIAAEVSSADAIKALPNFLHFGCGKCRKKQTPKIGCKECRAKAAENKNGYQRSPEGWIYQLATDVD